MVLDIAHGGHVVIAGAPRSGRSTVLRTIAGSVAAHASPADVHIYALDCGASTLLPLTSLPHCGAVVTRDQTERVERLLARLRGEITRRQQLLAAGGFAGIAEQRARTADPAQRLPWMVLLLHWWEGFNAAFEKYDFGRLIDGFLQLLGEGGAVGLCAVVTTDRLALTGHTGTVFERRMLLRLTDPGDSTLAGISERSLPSHQPAGRIVIEGTPDPLEVQVALLDADASGPAQWQRCSGWARHRWPSTVRLAGRSGRCAWTRCRLVSRSRRRGSSPPASPRRPRCGRWSLWRR